jgi:uncharacterized protein (DUF2336 family)
MNAPVYLIDELERALAAGTEAQRTKMLLRVSNLFMATAHRYSVGQINLFDEVISKLAAAIEAKTRARLAARFADVPNAPAGLIRMLAFDDDVEVARPVLKGSERLGDADLIANADSKSQLHLAAIAERKTLSEAVTDVLVTRGNRQVAQSVAKNTGARFSDVGFGMLVKRAASDETLAMQLGARRDLPRQHFLGLLEQASAAVRSRLAAENPAACKAIEGALDDVVGTIRSETRKVSSKYASAFTEVQAIKRTGRLGEGDVYRFARDGRFEETVVALSFLCGVEIDAVERALHHRSHEIALILAKLAGFSSTGAKAILLLKAGDRGIAAQDLDNALKSFGKLQVETAQRVLGFYRNRQIERARNPARAARA